MEYLKYIIEHIDVLLRWKNLIIGITVSFSLLKLYFINLFHDILQDMFKTIVISCILFIVLTACKISLEITDFINRKINAKRERKNKLELLLNLSKGEAALIKYLFFRPTQTAWFPPDWPEAILLLRKNCIEKIAIHRTLGLFNEKINLDKSTNDCLYTLEKSVADFIKTHQDEIMPKWKKINCNKKFNKYQ